MGFIWGARITARTVNLPAPRQDTVEGGRISNIINGGIECGPRASNPKAAEKRVSFFEAIAKEMGVSIPDGFLDDCSSQEPFSPCSSY